MTKIVNVTKDDIEKGIKGNCCGCPIALAIMHVIDCHVEVGVNFIKIGLGPLRNLSSEQITFIDNFDNNRPVQPFEFEIEL